MSWKAIKTKCLVEPQFLNNTRVGHHEILLFNLLKLFHKKYILCKSFPLDGMCSTLFSYFFHLGFKQQVVFEAIYMIPVDIMLTEQ